MNKSLAIGRRLTTLNSFFNNLSARSISGHALVYDQFGDPSRVVKKQEVKIADSIESNKMLVQFLAAPINPADINTIQGVYAIKPQLPAIGGNEGLAKVLKVGDQVKNVKVGDWVIPAQAASGTWRTHAVFAAEEVVTIDSSIDMLSAAQISVNPCTAYRMIKDFVDLKPGDSIIQNGANSAVGINVIQLAKEWGFRTINVVRDRPDLSKLKSRLTSLGADFVITEEELRQQEMSKLMFSKIPKPMLALNCVGGKNATDCMRLLEARGVMVTYGGMSKQPLTVPTSALIFKDQKFYGYWMTRWNQEKGICEERTKMIADLCHLIKQEKLKCPETIEINLNDYQSVFNKVMQGFVDAKYVFVMK